MSDVSNECLRATIERVRSLHKPFGVYDECDHQHESEDTSAGVFDVPDIGLTCLKMYDICRECCVGWSDSQSEWCADAHNHGPGKPLCKTREILDTTHGEEKP